MGLHTVLKPCLNGENRNITKNDLYEHNTVWIHGSAGYKASVVDILPLCLHIPLLKSGLGLLHTHTHTHTTNYHHFQLVLMVKFAFNIPIQFYALLRNIIILLQAFPGEGQASIPTYFSFLFCILNNHLALLMYLLKVSEHWINFKLNFLQQFQFL